MVYLRSFKMNIPELKDKVWDQAILEGDVISNKIRKVLCGSVQLLKRIDDTTLNPEQFD